MDQLTRQKRIAKLWLVWNIVQAILLLTAGVLSLVAAIRYDPDTASSFPVESITAYLLAAFVCLDGVFRVVMDLTGMKSSPNDFSSLLVSAAEITVGVLLVLLQVKYNSFLFTVVNAISLLVMATGALFLVYSIFAIAKKYSKLAMPLLQILFAAILISVGVVLIVLYYQNDNRQFVLYLSAVILLVAAIGMSIITFISYRKRMKEIKEAETGDYEVVDGSKSLVPAETIVEEPKKREDEPKQIGNKDKRKPKVIDE